MPLDARLVWRCLPRAAPVPLSASGEHLKPISYLFRACSGLCRMYISHSFLTGGSTHAEHLYPSIVEHTYLWAHRLYVINIHGAVLCLQRAATRWMLQRERRAGDVLPHPTFRQFQTAEDGFFVFGCSATGEVLTEAPPPVPDVSGGFFCDEPVSAFSLLSHCLRIRVAGHCFCQVLTSRSVDYW